MDKMALRLKERRALAKKLRNVNINDCTKALLGIVKDKQDGTIFYDYEPKTDIGRNIYAELLDKYQKGKGFILSDELEEIGLLSQTQGACSLDTLIGEFNVIEALPRQDAMELKEIYEHTVRDLLARIKTENGYLLDASPYNMEAFNEEYAYLDSMTWTVSALLGAITLNNNRYRCLDNKKEEIVVSFTEDEIKTMLDIIAYSIRYMVSCYIDNSEQKQKKLSCGWNFTKNCSEPSLYFTYAVSECYLDLYYAFRQVIDKHNIEIKLDNIRRDSSHTILNEEDAFLYLSGEDRIAYENINESKEEYKIQSEYFNYINGADDFFYSLEKQVKEAAYDAWGLVRNGIDSAFFNYNLSGAIDAQMIEGSLSSDALFNNVFVINNVISGGIDEEISDRLANSDDEDEMNRLQSEYDDLLETLQAALQRIIRYNKSLKSKQKDYIVNDYIIGCNESFVGDVSKKALELRKKRIKAFTISPLLVKTNNLISDFIAKYPQIDMIKYLDELLMKTRTTVDDKDEDGNTEQFFIWIWERGEYLVTSNYYYLTSLSSFYGYVDNYESRFSLIDHKNAKYKETLLSDYLQELRSSGEIFRLNSESKKLEESNEELRLRIRELESRESAVENALRSFLEQEIRSSMLDWMTGSMNDIADRIMTGVADEDFDTKYAGETRFLNAMKKALIASFYDQFKWRLSYSGLSPDKVVSMAEDLRKQFDKMIKEQLKSIVESSDFNKQWEDSGNV